MFLVTVIYLKWSLLCCVPYDHGFHIFFDLFRKLNQHKQEVISAAESKKDIGKRRAPPPPTRTPGSVNLVVFPVWKRCYHAHLIIIV